MKTYKERIMYVNGEIILKPSVSYEEGYRIRQVFGGGLDDIVCGDASLSDRYIRMHGVVSDIDRFERELAEIADSAEAIRITSEYDTSTFSVRYSLKNGRVIREDSECIFFSDLFSAGETDRCFAALKEAEDAVPGNRNEYESLIRVLAEISRLLPVRVLREK